MKQLLTQTNTPTSNKALPELESRLSLEPLADLPQVWTNLSKSNSPMAVASVELPKNKVEGLKIGAQYTYLATYSRVPNGLPGPPPGQLAIPEVKGVTQMAGFVATKSLKKNWFVESGLLYRHLSLDSEIDLNLRFEDFQHGGDPLDPEHSLEYTVATSGGLIDLELTANQSDPTEEIDGDEPVDLQLNVSHDFQKISLPLMIGYRIGHGQFGLALKTGILANFLIDNEFNIDRVEFRSNRFRHRRSPQPPSKQPRPKTTSFDYVAAAELQYELDSGLVLSLAPTVMQSIQGRSRSPFSRAKEFSTGVQAGIALQF